MNPSSGLAPAWVGVGGSLQAWALQSPLPLQPGSGGKEHKGLTLLPAPGLFDTRGGSGGMDLLWSLLTGQGLVRGWDCHVPSQGNSAERGRKPDTCRLPL